MTTPGRWCEACSTELPRHAVVCMECGYLLPPASEEDNLSVCPRWDCRHPNVGDQRFCERCVYPLPLPPGSLLADRYRISALLYAGPGRGGHSFGPIYQALDTTQNLDPVAVREFTRCEPDLYRVGLPFFHAAYDQLQLLQDNPLVPAVFEFIEMDTAAYIITEFLPGPSLVKLLDTRGNGFPLEQVVEWGKLLCELLDRMHSQRPPRLKHHLGAGDLLLDSQRRVKAVNFGLARHSPLYWPPLRVLTY